MNYIGLLAKSNFKNYPMEKLLLFVSVFHFIYFPLIAQLSNEEFLPEFRVKSEYNLVNPNSTNFPKFIITEKTGLDFALANHVNLGPEFIFRDNALNRNNLSRLDPAVSVILSWFLAGGGNIITDNTLKELS